jgi:hypothetical protein
MKLSAEQKIIIGHVRTIAKVLYGTGVVAIAIVCARLLGVTSVKALGLESPLRHVWVFIVAVTIAHLFLASTLINALGTCKDEEDDGTIGRKVFDTIRAEDNIFLRGLMPRQVPVREGSRIFRMHWIDPTTWLFCGLVILSWLAILPWRVGDKGLQ